jgi:electron transport complex protein RnfB
VHALRLPRLPRLRPGHRHGEAPSTAARPAAPKASPAGRLTGRPALPLDAGRGSEGPRALAVIDEAWCIGCTLCIKACPVDCIVGASKLMHTVIEPLCTGCELCVPACPVDCIAMAPVTGPAHRLAGLEPGPGRRGPRALRLPPLRLRDRTRENDERLAAKAQAKLADLASHSQHTDPAVLERKRAVIEAALQRAPRQPAPGPSPSPR